MASKQVVDCLKSTDRRIRKTLQSVINALLQKAKDHGLSTDEIDLIAKTLVRSKCVKSVDFTSVISSLIPATSVSENAVRYILMWVFSNHEIVSRRTVIVTLHWITGLLEYGLTNPETADQFYEMYFFLLKYQYYQPVLTKLMHIFTKPIDVSRWRVTQLLRIHNAQKNQRYTGAIINFFKVYRPDCVPEKINAIDIRNVSPRLPARLEEYLNNAQTRRSLQLQVKSLIPHLVWSMKPSGKKRKSVVQEIVPEVSYMTHNYTRRQRLKQSYSVMEFESAVDLGCFQMSVDIPSNVVSLLHNDAGFIAVAFGDDTLQSRFSYYVYHTLYSVLIQKKNLLQLDTIKYLLERLYLFENYMQQGIAVVSKILAQYLLEWDMVDFRKEIFHLLEWITFSSYDELSACILLNMEMIFFSGDVQDKCDVIKLLRIMVVNICNSGIFGHRNNIPGLFLKSDNNWEPRTVLKNISKFVSRLAVLGLSYETETYFLLMESLEFFEAVSELENLYDLPMYTCAPPGILYRCIFSTSPVLVCKACSLLLKYKKVTTPRIKKLKSARKFEHKIARVQSYINDVINAFAEGKMISNRHKGYILKDVPQTDIQSVQKYVDLDNVFRLQTHIGFTWLYKDLNIGHSEEGVREFLDVLETNWPEIVHLCNEDDKGFSSTSSNLE